MKKIFWTSIIWIIILVGGILYIKLFDKELSNNIANIIQKTETQIVMTTGSSQNTGVWDQLTTIDTEIDIIASKVTEIKEKADANQLNPMGIDKPTTVKLYYFNEKEDKLLDPSQQVNVNSVMPVSRTITATNDIIRDAINLLLEGALTADEIKQGFTTEFPNTQFHLVNYNLATNGVLTVEFNEVPGFTSGGSARMLILANSITKTLLQFSQVKEVVFTPNTLFQP